MTRERLYLFDTMLGDGQQTLRLARRRFRAEDRHNVKEGRVNPED